MLLMTISLLSLCSKIFPIGLGQKHGITALFRERQLTGANTLYYYESEQQNQAESFQIIQTAPNAHLDTLQPIPESPCL
jgi:hypothetical protein